MFSFLKHEYTETSNLKVLEYGWIGYPMCAKPWSPSRAQDPESEIPMQSRNAMDSMALLCDS